MNIYPTFSEKAFKKGTLNFRILLQNPGSNFKSLEALQIPGSNSKTLGAATPPSLTKTSILIILVQKSRIKTEKSIIVVFIVRTLKDDIYSRQMKMRPGELLLDQLDSIEDTKVNIYSHKVVFSVCLYVCS